MLNKSHRSVVSTCVLIFMPYLKKNNKEQLKKKTLKKHDLKKTVFFTSLHRTLPTSVKAGVILNQCVLANLFPLYITCQKCQGNIIGHLR